MNRRGDQFTGCFCIALIGTPYPYSTGLCLGPFRLLVLIVKPFSGTHVLFQVLALGLRMDHVE
jgi:hypothetical protein